MTKVKLQTLDTGDFFELEPHLYLILGDPSYPAHVKAARVHPHSQVVDVNTFDAIHTSVMVAPRPDLMVCAVKKAPTELLSIGEFFNMLASGKYEPRNQRSNETNGNSND